MVNWNSRTKPTPSCSQFNVIFIVVSFVQLMVTGVHGGTGARVQRRVVMAQFIGRARAITLLLLMAGNLAQERVTRQQSVAWHHAHVSEIPWIYDSRMLFWVIKGSIVSYERKKMFECFLLSRKFSLLVNGRWSVWSSWSPCSVSCGNGRQERMRKCNDPVPEYGGKFCQGPAREFHNCEEDDCPGNFITVFLTFQIQNCR